MVHGTRTPRRRLCRVFAFSRTAGRSNANAAIRASNSLEQRSSSPVDVTLMSQRRWFRVGRAVVSLILKGNLCVWSWSGESPGAISHRTPPIWPSPVRISGLHYPVCFESLRGFHGRSWHVRCKARSQPRRRRLKGLQRFQNSPAAFERESQAGFKHHHASIARFSIWHGTPSG